MPRRSTLRLWLAAGALSGIVSCSLVAPSDDELIGSCDDGVKNAPETDVDCGGGCRPCGESRGCKVGADCTTLSCVAGGCAAPSCTDKVKNGHETDVDCGGDIDGVSCPYCKLGQACVSLDDCDFDPVSLICVDEKCVVDTCSDNKKNGDETDLDCGGSCVAELAQTCLEGEGCKVPADCDAPCEGGKCGPPSCTDGFLNGQESDVDCGGADMTCPRCGQGKDCFEDGDCEAPMKCDISNAVCT